MSKPHNLNLHTQPEQSRKKNDGFYFTPELPSSEKNTERIENYVFFSHLLGLSTVCTGLFLYLLFPWSSEKQHRDLQSLTPAPPLISETLVLKPFVVRLKTKEGFRLSRIQVTLHIEPSSTLKEEIKNSSSAIKDQLLFMLSDKHNEALADSNQLQQLEQDLRYQLNLFLVEGKIKTLNMEQTFLSPD